MSAKVYSCEHHVNTSAEIASTIKRKCKAHRFFRSVRFECGNSQEHVHPLFIGNSSSFSKLVVILFCITNSIFLCIFHKMDSLLCWLTYQRLKTFSRQLSLLLVHLLLTHMVYRALLEQFVFHHLYTLLCQTPRLLDIVYLTVGF